VNRAILFLGIMNNNSSFGGPSRLPCVVIVVDGNESPPDSSLNRLRPQRAFWHRGSEIGML
jgi:hypothetical protein